MQIWDLASQTPVSDGEENYKSRVLFAISRIIRDVEDEAAGRAYRHVAEWAKEQDKTKGETP